MSGESYPLGAKVSYVDGGAVVSGDEVVLASGMVNGPAIENDEGEVVWVPVFSARDNGREATTIYVAAGNIMEVAAP